jgi:hypothetical protein
MVVVLASAKILKATMTQMGREVIIAIMGTVLSWIIVITHLRTAVITEESGSCFRFELF